MASEYASQILQGAFSYVNQVSFVAGTLGVVILLCAEHRRGGRPQLTTVVEVFLAACAIPQGVCIFLCGFAPDALSHLRNDYPTYLVIGGICMIYVAVVQLAASVNNRRVREDA